MAGAVEYSMASLQRVTQPNKSLEYDFKQSDGEIRVMLDLWGKRSTPSLPLAPSLLWPRVITSDRVMSKGKIKLKCVLLVHGIA